MVLLETTIGSVLREAAAAVPDRTAGVAHGDLPGLAPTPRQHPLRQLSEPDRSSTQACSGSAQMLQVQHRMVREMTGTARADQNLPGSGVETSKPSKQNPGTSVARPVLGKTLGLPLLTVGQPHR
jgi:hypothetical protein